MKKKSTNDAVIKSDESSSWGGRRSDNAWRVRSEQAAGFERQGYYKEAWQHWLMAFSLALSGADRHWCESRAMWCQRREQDSRDSHE